MEKMDFVRFLGNGMVLGSVFYVLLHPDLLYVGLGFLGVFIFNLATLSFVKAR